jgi:hypothetical protein
VEVNIAIMRTFVELRRLMDSNPELGRKIEAMEKKYDSPKMTRGARARGAASASSPSPRRQLTGRHWQ